MRDTRQPESPGPAEPGIRPSGDVPVWQPMLLGAAAGGLGWGIRGQYGHETGAMIAGLLVSLTWMVLFLRQAPASQAIRAVAWTTVAIGFGGAMTYGQTVGLTHDEALVGNWPALRWGMLGLAIKGALWIGFSGLFLGMSLGGVRYRPVELLALFAGMLGLYALGVWLLNTPFDPANRLLPALYFSDDWRWEPDADLKPRREVWGGLLFALFGAIAYAGFLRRDALTRRLAGWAMLGGALGFPAGQSLQAFHAWNLPLFRSGTLARLDPLLNWWNFMETTFGAVFGAVLGLGLWRNRHVFAVVRLPAQPPESGDPHPPSTSEASNPATGLEWGLILLALHTALLVISEFTSIPILERYTDIPLLMGVLPILAAAQGRWSPWLVALPITLLPIAGKTLRHLVYEQPSVPPAVGWFLYAIVPVVVATVFAFRQAAVASSGASADRPLRLSLGLATLVYFSLNYAFFRFPWPWSTWTQRTPNALVFTACAAALLVLAWSGPPAQRQAGNTSD